MHTARAYVSNHKRCVWSDLTLDVQVPLHHVIALGIRFDVVNVCRRRVRNKRGEETNEACGWEITRLQKRTGGGGGGRQSKGKCVSDGPAQVQWKNLHVEHSEPRADGGFTVAEWVPR